MGQDFSKGACAKIGAKNLLPRVAHRKLILLRGRGERGENFPRLPRAGRKFFFPYRKSVKIFSPLAEGGKFSPRSRKAGKIFSPLAEGGQTLFSALAATYEAKLATNVQHGEAQFRLISSCTCIC